MTHNKPTDGRGKFTTIAIVLCVTLIVWYLLILADFFVTIITNQFGFIDAMATRAPKWLTTGIMLFSLIAPVVIGVWSVIVGRRWRRAVKAAGLSRGRMARYGLIVLGVVTIGLPATPFLLVSGKQAIRSWTTPTTPYDPWADLVPPRAAELTLDWPVVSREEIESQVRAFDDIAPGTTEERRTFCLELMKAAGYEPTVNDAGDVIAVKHGRRSEYVSIGAHYDMEGHGSKSKGILDNMLGCIVVAAAARSVQDRDTDLTYAFVFYGDEETGRKFPTRVADDGDAAQPEKPVYSLEVDYIGDRRSNMLVRYVFSSNETAHKRYSLKITAFPHPTPSTIHTDLDNIDSVDFAQAHQCVRSVVWMMEGLEQGLELEPAPVLFLRYSTPMHTLEYRRQEKPLLPRQ